MAVGVCEGGKHGPVFIIAKEGAGFFNSSSANRRRREIRIREKLC